MKVLPTVVLALLLLPVVPAQPGLDLPDGFERVGEGTALASAVSLHRDQVAWAGPGNGMIGIWVANLTTGETERAAEVADPDGTVQVESLTFDGDWVAWSDDRFGQFEVFAVEVATGTLRRLSDHPLDDTDVDGSQGRLVWVRGSAIHMAALGTGNTTLFQTRTGPAPNPSIDGERVVWTQANATERYIVVRQEGVDEPLVVARSEPLVRIQPVLDGDLVLWRTLHLPDEANASQGPRGIRLELARLQVVEDNGTKRLVRTALTNLTPLQALKDHDLSAGRVAWREPASQTEARGLVRDLTTGESTLFPAPVGPIKLSPTHAVVVADQGESGPLYARAWEQPETDGGGGSAPSWPLLAAGAAAVAAGLLWTPAKRWFRRDR